MPAFVYFLPVLGIKSKTKKSEKVDLSCVQSFYEEVIQRKPKGLEIMAAFSLCSPLNLQCKGT